MAEKSYFTDVPNVETSEPTGTVGGSMTADNLSSLQVGAGTKVFRGDSSGIWLGATKWADAPFRVNMSGDLWASSATFPNLVTITIFKQSSIPTSTAVGDLWFDTDDNNKMYRSGVVGADAITAGEWELVNTVGVQIFAQDAIPTSLNVGDLWYDTNDNNKPYRAASVGANEIVAGEWEAVDDQRAADALLKADTSQVLSGDFGVGDGDIKIDGANKRILITSGGTPIIVIGYVA
jgi:hypothetical protein